MKESKYIGNFKDTIDCDKLIESLKNVEGDKRTPENPYSTKTSLSKKLMTEKLKIQDLWINAGYSTSDSVEWVNFYPEFHFDVKFVEIFSQRVNATPYNVWISSMSPGKCIPIHWDIINNYEQHELNPKIVRYSFFIDKPQVGKIFVLNNEAYHNIDQGSVYEWNKWNEWHLGFNCGLTQKYLFHYIGFKH
jgi:hypothetical protein